MSNLEQIAKVLDGNADSSTINIDDLKDYCHHYYCLNNLKLSGSKENMIMQINEILKVQ